MPTIHVPGDQPTIAAAMAVASPGDTIQLDPNYKNEAVTVSVDNLAFAGDASNTGVTLTLGATVTTVRLTTITPWTVIDNSGDNAIIGNGLLAGPDGPNIVTVSGGNDTVAGGVNIGGFDTLIVNYASSALNILTTGNPFDNSGTVARYTDGGNNSVDFSGIERFVVTTGSGADTIITGDNFGPGNPGDIVSTGAGNDSIDTRLGVAIVNGGAGTDFWSANFADNTAAITLNLNLAGTQALGNGSQATSIERINLRLGNPATQNVIVTRTGAPNDGLADTIAGGDANDVVTVGGGLDIFNAGLGTDRLIVDYATETLAITTIGNPSDTFGPASQFTDGLNTGVTFTGVESFHITTGSGADVLRTGIGDDFLKGNGGVDTLTGGVGADTADYSEKATAVVSFLNGANFSVVQVGGVNEDIIREIENLNGGSGNDSLVGDGAANILRGNAGADYLFSNGFNPDGTMKGFAGSDTLNGDAGDDGLFAGDGNDTLNGGEGADGMVGGGGNDTLNGGAGADFLFGGAFSPAGAQLPNSGVDTLNGGAGNDGLYGFDGVDTINGDAGNDYVEGGAGNDVINGGAGSDYLLGGADADTINGGTGFDYLYGEAGADTFIFRKSDSADWILDFSAAAGDKLRLLDFGYANFGAVPLVDLSTPGNPAVQFTFSGPGGVDQLTIFGVTLAQLNATNVLVA